MTTESQVVQTAMELPVRPESRAAVVALFAELGVLELAGRNEGFLRGRLLVPEDPVKPIVVLSEWDGFAAIQRWVDDPARIRVNEALAPHLDGEPVRHEYTIALEWPDGP